MMDVVGLLHGSLTIDDKPNSRDMNVHFSSSDTDISLSSSSMLSSSSSLSLFSFDGPAEGYSSSASVATTLTTVVTTPTAVDAVTEEAIKDSDVEESLSDVTLIIQPPMRRSEINGIDETVERNHSESTSTIQGYSPDIQGIDRDDQIPNVFVETSCCNNTCNNNNNDNVDEHFIQIDPTETTNLQENELDTELCSLGDDQSSDVSSLSSHQSSKFSDLNDSVFEINLENLIQYNNFDEDLEKRKIGSNFVVCDLDPDNHLTQQLGAPVQTPVETLIDVDPLPANLPVVAEPVTSSKETLNNVFSLAEDLKNYEERSMGGSPAPCRTTSQSGTGKEKDDEGMVVSATPNKKGHHVRFPSDGQLVTGYVDPSNPWKDPSECSTEELLSSYRDSCALYDIEPFENVVSQLKEIKDFEKRSDLFTLKGMAIDWKVCETLETIFKRVQFETVDLESTELCEQTAAVMFDLLNYYEPCIRLILSSNSHVGNRGWQACGNYLKQSRSLKCLEARHSVVPEYSFSQFIRGIQYCTNLTTVHLQNSISPGRSLQLLASGLRSNRSVRDVYLGDNRFNPSDGLQIANLVKDNGNLQLIDLRNNNLQDTGAAYIFEALAQSSNCSLNTLVIWNNKLTKGSMSMLSKMLKTAKSLETINLGHNSITDEGMYRLKEGLIKNNSLLRIGLQAIKVTCEGVVALAEFIIEHGRLQKLDLRGNQLKTAGLMALSQSLKVNKSVTCVAMDTEVLEEERTRNETSDGDEDKAMRQYMEDILSYTNRNLNQQHLVECQESACSCETEEANPDEEEEEPHVTSDPLSVGGSSVSADSRKSLQRHMQIDISSLDFSNDQSNSSVSSERKKSFQFRCQMLESPSISSVENPFAGKIPVSGKTHYPSLGQISGSSSSSQSSMGSVTMITADECQPAVQSSETSHCGESSSSTTAPTDSLASATLQSVFQPELNHSSSSSSTAQSTMPPADTVKTTSSSSLPAATVSTATATASTTTAAVNAKPPPTPKRKFTVSKTKLPSIFGKSSSQHQQPSVLYTAPSGSTADGMGVTEGRAKVRIIGIQSEEKENSVPMETSSCSDDGQMS